MRQWIFAVAACALMAVSAHAHAQDHTPLADSLTGSAKTDYDIGRILFRDKDYANALLKFQSAYNAAKDKRLLWNIAACEKDLRHYARALRLVLQYEAKAPLTADEKDDADAVVTELKTLVAPLRVNVEIVGAHVFVDNEDVGVTPLSDPVTVSLGTRIVRVTKPGFVTAERTVTVKDPTELALDVALAPEIHEGRIVVIAHATDTIRIDTDKFVSMGRLEARLATGPHRLLVTAPGMRKQESDVIVEENRMRSITITLEKEKGGGLPLWAWLGGGTVLAAGVAVAAYFIVTAVSASTSPFQTTAGKLGGIGLMSFH